MTKTFEFTSFEQAQHFVQRVGKFCTKKDHHPEWQVTNGGKTVQVRLTSHFAGNKVTLYDFQLAEEMNKSFKITLREFWMHPLTTGKPWVTYKIYACSFFIAAVLFNFGYYFGNMYPTSAQRG